MEGCCREENDERDGQCMQEINHKIATASSERNKEHDTMIE